MPSTLPVPSKGALRTLRALALGTSCTVVFTAGVLTVDQRRRILAARQVHNNAKKLKASRQYHDSRLQLAETFEEQILRYRDDAFWLAGQSKEKEKTKGVDSARKKQSDCGREELEAPMQKPEASVTSEKPRQSRIPSILRIPQNRPVYMAMSDVKTSSTARRKVLNRQLRLALDITAILRDERDPVAIRDALSRFLEAFDEGVEIEEGGIQLPLINAASKLSQACKNMSDFDAMEKILDIILAYGPIEEEHFWLFEPEIVIENLLRDAFRGSVEEHAKTTGWRSLTAWRKIYPRLEDPAKLRKASALYLTKFKAKYDNLSEKMLSLGAELCISTCQYSMYDLTIDLHWRRSKSRGDSPDEAESVNHLITAQHATGRHRLALRSFRNMFTHALTPSKTELFKIVDCVLDSAFQLQDFDQAEKVLLTGVKMAKAHHYTVSTTWLLKLLGHHWRFYFDIIKTQALFSRLEPLIQLTQYPEAVYAAIIQCCVEANDEPAAKIYRSTFTRIYNAEPNTRMCGHFALAKAMRGDWTGVSDDFKRISKMNRNEAEYAALFVPILKLFKDSHSLNETEDFLRYFIEEYKVPLTLYMSNLMIKAYGEAREIESISRWVQFTNSISPMVSSQSFNAILINCVQQWKLSFKQATQLSWHVQKLESGSSAFVDHETKTILRNSAIREGKSPAPISRKLYHIGGFQFRKYTSESRRILGEMQIAMARRNNEVALGIYEKASAQGIFIHPKVLSCAVRASLSLNRGNLNNTIRLLHEAHRKGVDHRDALVTLLLHQISELDSEARANRISFLVATQGLISTVEKRGIVVPIDVFTSVANHLVNRRQYQEAKSYWQSLLQSRPLLSSSLDVPALSVLLKAYIETEDCGGVQWVMKVLSTNELTPDNQFKLLLKNVLKSPRDHQNSQFLGVIDEAFHKCKSSITNDIKTKDEIAAKVIAIMQKAVEAQRKADQEQSSTTATKHPESHYRTRTSSVPISSRDAVTSSAFAWGETDRAQGNENMIQESFGFFGN